jgi:hypothetical protein
VTARTLLALAVVGCCAALAPACALAVEEPLPWRVVGALAGVVIAIGIFGRPGAWR